MAIASLCESYAVTALASLKWGAGEEERPIERIAAVGRAAVPIAAALWKARDGLDSRAYKNLEKQLLVIYRSRYGDVQVIAEAIVSQALREYFSKSCRRCSGKREVMEGKLKAACPECCTAGTSSGLHRYTDTERAMTMKISFAQTKRAAHKIHWLLGVLANDERRLALGMSAQLERR